MRPDLYQMFNTLENEEQEEWGEIVQLPLAKYLERLGERAEQYTCLQKNDGDIASWIGRAGNLELMFFRIPDPGNLRAIQGIYTRLDESSCPIAYAFVNQRGDHQDAWDVFQFSRLSYMCHCNRVNGPGSECEA